VRRDLLVRQRAMPLQELENRPLHPFANTLDPDGACRLCAEAATNRGGATASMPQCQRLRVPRRSSAGAQAARATSASGGRRSSVNRWSHLSAARSWPLALRGARRGVFRSLERPAERCRRHRLSLLCLDSFLDDHREAGRGMDVARQHGKVIYDGDGGVRTQLAATSRMVELRLHA
jgi:hypothetical protein